MERESEEGRGQERCVERVQGGGGGGGGGVRRAQEADGEGGEGLSRLSLKLEVNV